MGKRLKKISAMHAEYGVKTNTRCTDCVNLVSHRLGGRTFYKCVGYGVTQSEATDWRLSYVGCGMHGKEFIGEPIMGRSIMGQSYDEPLEGQQHF